jgi:hypothetical protein
VSDRSPLDGWHFTSFVVTDRGPNSAARWRSSVPLARPLSPPDSNPLSVLRLIRQVLRELRVILCQTLQADIGSNGDIRNFCPKVVTLSTGLFTQSTTSNYLDSCFPQPEGLAGPSSDSELTHWSPRIGVRPRVSQLLRKQTRTKWCLNLRRMPDARTKAVTNRSISRRERMVLRALQLRTGIRELDRCVR